MDFRALLMNNFEHRVLLIKPTAVQRCARKNNRTWGPYPLGLPLTSLWDFPLLFVYFQVNNGVVYYLDYVEDIYIRVLSVLVSILNPNHIVFTTSNKLYTTIRASLFPFQSLTPNHT